MFDARKPNNIVLHARTKVKQKLHLYGITQTTKHHQFSSSPFYSVTVYDNKNSGFKVNENVNECDLYPSMFIRTRITTTKNVKNKVCISIL